MKYCKLGQCPIFERLEKHLGKENIKTIMLTGKTHNLGGEGGEPFYLSKNHIDVFDLNSANADVVGKKALSYLEEYKNERYFAFFHFSDPNHKGHRFGENSKEYEEGIKMCDLWLGKIISKLKKQ
ncbi:MAG: alkaline phosphatase family protein [Candidatus Methanofastidiosia archaeon]